MTVPEDRPWFQFWPKGVPKSIEYPEIPLFELLADSCRKHPDRRAVVQDRRAVTYRELDELSSRLAAGLEALGVEKGSRVLLFLSNTIEYVISYYGILKAGAVVTAASPLFKEMELEYQLADCGAKTVITASELCPIVDSCREKTRLNNVVSVGGGNRKGAHSFESLLATGELPNPRRPLDAREETAVLQYTGGTTGLPKGAMMSHYNLVANAIQNARWFGWSSDDVVMAALAFCHTWGTCVCINSPVYVAATVVLLPSFDPRAVLQLIEKEKVSILYGSATMFNMLVNCPDIEGHDLSSLRLAKAGAMPIPAEVKRRWDEMTGLELVLGYGLTEASPETHDSPPARIKPGSVGIPITDTDAKVVDLETGQRTLPPGEIGELVLKGPQVMSGYWNCGGERGGALREGWLHTGDVARMDDEGYFYIIDRVKDLIKYKGYSVFPAEVENVLYNHPAVKECLVVGRAEPAVGEIPKAFVVLKAAGSATEQELLIFCQNRISAYKRVREVEFVSELPKTVTGKPLRRLMRGETQDGDDHY